MHICQKKLKCRIYAFWGKFMTFNKFLITLKKGGLPQFIEITCVPASNLWYCGMSFYGELEAFNNNT